MKRILLILLIIALTNAQCTLPEVQKFDDQYNEICVEPIEGCETYSSSNLGKCHECYQGHTGEQGTENSWGSCTCSTNILKPDSNNDLRCIPELIDNCR